MLDYLIPMKNQKFDFLTFLEGDVQNSIQIQGNEYSDPGIPLGGSSLGDEFHIVLFRDLGGDSDEYGEPDSFDAVLADPLEYISGLIPAGWYGIIARKTTTSRPIIDRMLDNFK